jgi:hypothetical protein
MFGPAALGNDLYLVLPRPRTGKRVPKLYSRTPGGWCGGALSPGARMNVYYTNTGAWVS